jgi:hypothetical protein
MELNGLLRYYCHATLYVVAGTSNSNIMFRPVESEIGNLSPLESSSATANHSGCCFKFRNWNQFF